MKDLKDLTYEERLHKLNLPSVKFRQTRSDLIQTFKIIQCIDNVESTDFFMFVSVNSTRNSSLKLYREYAKTVTRSNFLTNRVNKTWNSLSTNTRASDSILKFKKNIDSELFHLTYMYDS